MKQSITLLTAALAWCFWHPCATAQQVVVQQPEFRQFAVPTTVLVPDRGAALLGGTIGAARGQSIYGPVPMARAGAAGTGSSSVQVRAYVHDFQAMDAKLLGQAAGAALVTPAAAPRRRSPFHGLPGAAAPLKHPPLAHLRTDVESALRDEAAASDVAEHGAAIRRLVELHDQIIGDPRHATNVSIRGLGRRLAMRLVETHDTLVATAAGGDAAEAQALIDLIQATISPETWDINGGRGSIVYFANGHALVVRAPGDVHDDLGGLLRQLR
jgi:hypothetical protein